jgi:excisionase family DNA binding protein
MDWRPVLEEHPELLLKPQEAARLLGVTERCLRRWAQEGRIRAVRTAGGHYRYPLDSVLQIIGSSPQSSPERTAALYARAACRREIERQLGVLRKAADAMGYIEIHERMAESLPSEARKMNREILQALRILQRRHRIRWEEE